MFALIILQFAATWLVWIMIYWVQQYHTPKLMPWGESRDIQLIRDFAVCHHICSNDDILTVEDVPLFMTVLQGLDFVYFTVVPSLLTLMMLTAVHCGFG